jgi:N-acetylneuraminic acid mutarotase
VRSTSLSRLIASGSGSIRLLFLDRTQSHFNLLLTGLIIVLSCARGAAQTNEWTWMGGSNTFAANGYPQPGMYGTQGTPAAGNIPGASVGSVSWTDSSGNLWLFGGLGVEGAGANDLWEFNPSTSQWAWISGSNPATVSEATGVYGTRGLPAATNVPGGRSYAVAWTDASGNLWLFGGYGFDSGGDSGLLNDLWEFSPSTGQWVWINGSSTIGTDCVTTSGTNQICGQPGLYGTEGTAASGNTPGARQIAAVWTDKAGHLWLEGGYGFDSVGRYGYLNDLWMFDPSTTEWTWVAGPSTLSQCTAMNSGACVEYGQPGVYGTLGTPNSANTPGGRDSGVTWTDASGNLWLFGGYGLDQSGTKGYLDDLWELNASNGQWTWISGSSVIVETSTYGTLGVPAGANVPPGRSGAVGWVDSGGNLWLFGGSGMNPASNLGDFDDLWMLDASNDEWAWMGGNIAFSSQCTTNSGAACSEGVYGTLGTPAAGNTPGSRTNAVAWADVSGNFWLFGGEGVTTGTVSGELNDFWRYQPSATSLPPAITPTFSPVPGTYGTAQTVTIANGMSNASIYYTIDGSTPTTSSTLYTGPVTVSSTENIQAIAAATGYPTSGVAAGTYVINLLTATPTFSIPAGMYTSTQTVTITDATPGAVIYYTTDGTTPTTSSPLYSGPITVSASEKLEAIAVATGYGASAVASASYQFPAAFTLAVSPSSLSIQSGGQGTVTVTVTPQNGFSSTVSFACSGLTSGAWCSFGPTAVTPSGAPITTSLTITTPTVAGALRRDSRPVFPGSVLVLSLCILSWKRRRGLQMMFLVSAAVVGLGLISGCGSSSKGTTAATSTVTVTATAGSLNQTATLALTVK